ncbi:Hypothetical predicted protein [Prunus dulcis]|uniref:Uncharacterized protein n=1 Tax=Prunus dulcis TaxID=3755 RepID=A0A5E4G9P1_PRUDU|nr:Hypothetical predicted protein [Prunus dulcis]
MADQAVHVTGTCLVVAAFVAGHGRGAHPRGTGRGRVSFNCGGFWNQRGGGTRSLFSSSALQESSIKFVVKIAIHLLIVMSK